MTTNRAAPVAPYALRAKGVRLQSVVAAAERSPQTQTTTPTLAGCSGRSPRPRSCGQQASGAVCDGHDWLERVALSASAEAHRGGDRVTNEVELGLKARRCFGLHPRQ